MLKEMLGTESVGTFKIANKLWMQSGVHVSDNFKRVLSTFYNSSAALVDFTAESESVRLEISKWVEGQTDGRIKDLISQGMLNFLTRFVITNAIYFKGKWSTPFNKKNTRAAPFYYGDNRSTDIEMMHLYGKQFPYFHDDRYKCQILSMPYTGSNLLMVVVLPEDGSSLAALEEQLCKDGISTANFMKWTTARPIKVDVIIPRFKFEWDGELSGVLGKLGMADLFTSQANLSGISGSRDLFANYVVHKASVEMNEEGIEAAAATAVIGKLGCAATPLPRPVFNADHPFLFAIFDKKTSAVVFLGRVADPCVADVALGSDEWLD